MAREEIDDPAGVVGISGIRDVVDLGATSVARVFFVVDERSGRRVVIRVLHAVLDAGGLAELAVRQDTVALLRRHPNISRVLTHGENANGFPFVVNEVVDGVTVAELLERGRHLDVAEVLRIGVRSAGAIESLNRVGVVSGLLGPADISLGPNREPVFSGLGLRTSVPVGSVRDARPGHLALIAPELVSGAEASPVSDVYALGALLFCLLTGTAPYGGDGITREVIHRIETGRLPDLRDRGVPDEVAEVVEKAMANEPSARFGDVLELGKACQHVELDLGLAATQMLVKSHKAGDGRVPRSGVPVPTPGSPPPRGTATAHDRSATVATPAPAPAPGPAPGPSTPVATPRAAEIPERATSADRRTGLATPDDHGVGSGSDRRPLPVVAPRVAVVAGGVLVVVLLVVVLVVSRSGGSGPGDAVAGGSTADAGEEASIPPSAAVPATPSVGDPVVDPSLDSTEATDALGVVSASLPNGWTTVGSPGARPGGGEMPMIVSAVDPAAFVDADGSLATEGVRITVDRAAEVDPGDSANLLERFLSSSLTAGGRPVTDACPGTLVPLPVEVGELRGSFVLRGGCGAGSAAVEVAVLITPDGRTVVTFEGHAMGAPGLRQLNAVLRSLVVRVG